MLFWVRVVKFCMYFYASLVKILLLRIYMLDTMPRHWERFENRIIFVLKEFILVRDLRTWLYSQTIVEVRIKNCMSTERLGIRGDVYRIFWWYPRSPHFSSDTLVVPFSMSSLSSQSPSGCRFFPFTSIRILLILSKPTISPHQGRGLTRRERLLGSLSVCHFLFMILSNLSVVLWEWVPCPLSLHVFCNTSHTALHVSIQ